MNNQFFEIEELEFMRSQIPEQAVIVDIGANVGNHTIYFSKFMNAKTIYSIEPVPRSYKMLLANIALNYCHNVNVDFLGLALGDRSCVGYPLMIYGPDNLGAATISPSPFIDQANPNVLDPVKVVRGDSLFANIDIDFIKMDVERMEIVALEGLKETIDRCRPKMFIEVSGENYEDFRAWVKNNNYIIHSTHDKYSAPIFANYFILPL